MSWSIQKSMWNYGPSKSRPAVRVGHSSIRQAGPVTFPPFSATRVYMEQFYIVNGRVMVDSHLFDWRATLNMMLAGTNAKGPGYIMIDQAELKAGEIHRRAGRHIDGAWNSASTQMMLLASDVVGCAAYVGDYTPNFGADGDAAQVDVSKMERVVLQPNTTYIASPFTTIHESIPVEQDCRRTLVRIHAHI